MFDTYPLFKSIAFKMDPENAHEMAMKFLTQAPHLASFLAGNSSVNEKLKIKVGNNTWTFPVGLAAGLDKNGAAIDYFSRLNFGAVEVGTVTPKAQVGNEKPRLFRYPEEESLRNRMGFNNYGSNALELNIANSDRGEKVLGVNLGKNKVTPQEKAVDDYCHLYKKFAPICDYLVVNVSSPNTPGLRDLQQTKELKVIFDELSILRKEVNTDLFLKIAPDLADEDLIAMCDLAKEYDLTGLIATNTTIMPERGPGGISGRLLHEKGRNIRKLMLENLKETSNVELIGVGGISSFDDLWEFWQLGGKAVQVYTSFIYQGPAMLERWKNELESILLKNDLSSFEQMLSNIQKVKR